MNKNTEEDVKVQQEIQRLYTCIVLNQKLSHKGIEKAKQLMMIYLKEVVGQALNRSISRDGASAQLQAKDLLTVIQSKGDIYKFKIARTLLMSKTRNQISEKPAKQFKTMKQQQFAFKDDDDDDDK